LAVLIVTGILAKPIVQKYVGESKVPAEVVSFPIEVAALMSPQYISTMLRSVETSKIDKILLPGLIPGDVSIVEDATGIPTFKGPKHAADIPVVLEAMNSVQLSSTIPASDLIFNAIREHAWKDLEAIQEEEIELARRGFGIPIEGVEKTLWIGPGYSPRVLGEIVDASVLPDETIRALATGFVESGAEIVDIGMVAGGGDPQNAKRAVSIAKETVPGPVSIDTSDVDEMKAAVEAGVDLILSVNASTLKPSSKFATQLPVVVTPTNSEGFCPTETVAKLEQLNKNIELASTLGFKKIIADPVLVPLLTPSSTESLIAYSEFKKENPSLPVLFGAGNVTELVDCDSLGANALLAALACELGTSIILTTEASNKTKGSVREVSTAVKMAMLSRRRKSPPKDLGFDLLVVKEKRRHEEPYDRNLETTAKVVRAPSREFIYDPQGCFRILLNRDRAEIVLSHFVYGSNQPDLIVKGFDPLDITTTVIENGLISRMDHAAYLGAELEKAQIALITGKSYTQDLALFGKDLK